jgi:uncharacterized membrane protein YphA (DoxX/SURF4 family)
MTALSHFNLPQKILTTESSFMKIALWIVSGLLAFVFFASAYMKLFNFDQYTQMAPALADSRGLVRFIGLCELAGAIGLILPRLTGILPVLSTWAAVGLATIMVLATGSSHARRVFSRAHHRDHLRAGRFCRLWSRLSERGRVGCVPRDTIGAWNFCREGADGHDQGGRSSVRNLGASLTALARKAA